MIGHLLEVLGEWARMMMVTLGYPGLILVMMIENVFPPIPSELVLPLAGFLAHEGEANFSLPLVVLAGGLGSVLGALILYAFGAWTRDHGGRRVLLAVVRYAFVTEKDLDAAESWFHRHRALAVLTGRFVPVVRSLISIPAGYNRMPMPEFLVLTAIGTTIWCAILVSAGWMLGVSWPLVRSVMSRYEQLVVVAAVLLVLAFVGWRLRDRMIARAH
jgi:membrane protein DedA with SNARE-associated domain